MELAQRHESRMVFTVWVSPRTSLIADLAVATNAGQIKTGAPARSGALLGTTSRCALRKSYEAAVYAGKSALCFKA